VDFIDMADEAHREAVTEKLREALALDKAKCNVLEMSELCSTQFTRKRVGRDMHSYLVKPCPHCAGRGHVQGDVFVITRLREALLDCFARGYQTAIVDLNTEILNQILKEGLFTPEVNNRWKNKRIYMIPHKTYKEECFYVRGENAGILQLPDKAKLLY
jgi:Ribonuclease G/E